MELTEEDSLLQTARAFTFLTMRGIEQRVTFAYLRLERRGKAAEEPPSSEEEGEDIQVITNPYKPITNWDVPPKLIYFPGITVSSISYTITSG